MSDDGAVMHSARRFAEQIPILVEMERDCNSNLRQISERIRVFYTDPTLQSRLLHWVEHLYKCRQRVRDWDISWNLYTEIEDATREMHPKASTEELIAFQMIINTTRQYEELTRYREMYPDLCGTLH